MLKIWMPLQTENAIVTTVKHFKNCLRRRVKDYHVSVKKTSCKNVAIDWIPLYTAALRMHSNGKKVNETLLIISKSFDFNVFGSVTDSKKTFVVPIKGKYCTALVSFW